MPRSFAVRPWHPVLSILVMLPTYTSLSLGTLLLRVVSRSFAVRPPQPVLSILVMLPTRTPLAKLIPVMRLTQAPFTYLATIHTTLHLMRTPMPFLSIPSSIHRWTPLATPRSPLIPFSTWLTTLCPCQSSTPACSHPMHPSDQPYWSWCLQKAHGLGRANLHFPLQAPHVLIQLSQPTCCWE